MNENLAAGQADAWAATLAEYWAAFDHLADPPAWHDSGDCEECDDIRATLDIDPDRDALQEYLDELPLELVWEVGEEFAVVLGTGGPHTEIVGGSPRSGAYRLECYWGGHRATRSGEAVTRTGDYFRELLEETS